LLLPRDLGTLVALARVVYCELVEVPTKAVSRDAGKNLRRGFGFVPATLAYYALVDPFEKVRVAS